MNIPKNVYTKEQFVEAIKQIEYCRHFEEDLYKVFSKYMCDEPSFVTVETALIDALNVMFNQKDDKYGTDIEYFIYEIDFGRDFKMGDYTCNGENIDLSTPEKLYDWLIKNGFEEGESDGENTQEG